MNEELDPAGIRKIVRKNYRHRYTQPVAKVEEEIAARASRLTGANEQACD